MSKSSVLSVHKQSAMTIKDRQRLIAPELRITQGMGDVLLRACRHDKYEAWTTRAKMNRLLALGLVTFVESIYKSNRLQYHVKLTNKGLGRAKEIAIDITNAR